MLIHVVPPSVERSHLMTDSVCPDSVSRVLLVPVQTVVPPVTAPGTVAGSTVTVAVDELVSGHTPLCTTALYCVVTVRLVAV